MNLRTEKSGRLREAADNRNDDDISKVDSDMWLTGYNTSRDCHVGDSELPDCLTVVSYPVLAKEVKLIEIYRAVYRYR
jgi:hypothetical protein